MNERKWRQPQLQLVTKSCRRQELGLPTSSAAVLPLKMMLWTMFQSIQTFSVNGKFTEHYHIFCAWTDLLFTIFVGSRYRPWAPIRLLHHYGFVMFVNSRVCCMHFSCHWCKVCKICGWRKSLKGSMTPHPHPPILILSTKTLFVWLLTLMNIYLFCPQKLFVQLLTLMNIHLFCP